MDKNISFLLSAGETLKRTIDPECILNTGTILNICHRISENDKEFAWSAEVEFPNNDILKIRGQYSPESGNIIQRCIYNTRDEKLVLPILPSRTLLKALGNITQLPPRMKANLARIGQNVINSEQKEDDYDICLLESAQKALLWEVDGNELTETRHFRFNEISMTLQKDPTGFYSKNTIVGCCDLENAIIKARTIVDMYGLSSQVLTLDKPLNTKDAISAYCYTEDFTGRKVPSLRVAFKLYYQLTGTGDLQQRRIKNSMEVPTKKKIIQTDRKITHSEVSALKSKNKETQFKYPERIRRHK